MLAMYLRWPVLLLIAFSTAVCATMPTGPGTKPPAMVHAIGNLSFPNCSDGKCAYEGQIINDGPECAVTVHGVTHLFDAAGKEIETQQWEVLGRVRPVPTPTAYTACCFSQTAVSTYRTYRTDVSFAPLKCI